LVSSNKIVYLYIAIMSTIVKNTVTKVSDLLPKDWEAGTKDFSANEVISAYFLGKEDGKKEDFEKYKNQFSLNIKLASAIAEELFEIGMEKKIDLRSIHLKANSLSSFEALFLVSKDSIQSDNFRNAYVISRTLRNKYKSDKFNLYFSFTPQTEEVDINCLAADGFFMRYEKGKAD
jgi:hypothetical protein